MMKHSTKVLQAMIDGDIERCENGDWIPDRDSLDALVDVAKEIGRRRTAGTAVKQVIIKKDDITFDCDGDLVMWIAIPDDLVLLPVDGAYKISDVDNEQADPGVDMRVVPPGKVKNYAVWITLCQQYEATGDDEAYDMAMADIGERGGMEISSHEVICDDIDT